MIIRARAPLRLGLAGGGTDVSPYCDVYGGMVLNATIDRYAYAVIRTLNEPIARLIASDQQVAVESTLSSELQIDGQLDLHKSIYNHMMKNYNDNQPIALELTTFCDAPMGSGLGSSSTLVVVMIRAFVELLNLALDDYEVARLAFKIEREECGLKGGRQDQYAATFGGVNFMEFYDQDRVVVNPLRVKNWILCELEASLILFYTGVSRESSRIISAQSNNVTAGEQDAIEAMHGIKEEALVMKESLLRGNFDGIVESMREGWQNKKRTAKTVSSAHLDAMYDAALQAGARSGKISGAGGGGFMLFFVPAESRMDVCRALGHFEGQLSNCHFTAHGSQAWRL